MNTWNAIKAEHSGVSSLADSVPGAPAGGLNCYMNMVHQKTLVVMAQRSMLSVQSLRLRCFMVADSHHTKAIQCHNTHQYATSWLSKQNRKDAMFWMYSCSKEV